MPDSPLSGTVGVGVGIIVIRSGMVLLGERTGSHGAGTWCVPGGRLEYGESIEACARRELLEETSLVLGTAQLGPYTNHVFEDIQQQYLTVFVLTHDASGTPRTVEPDKCKGWLWFDWSALPTPLFGPLASLVASGFAPK